MCTCARVPAYMCACVYIVCARARVLCVCDLCVHNLSVNASSTCAGTNIVVRSTMYKGICVVPTSMQCVYLYARVAATVCVPVCVPASTLLCDSLLLAGGVECRM